MPKVGIIHTTRVTVPLMRDAFAQAAPEIEVMDLLHDGLLTEVIRAGGLTPAITRVLCRHVVSAADLGCDVVLGACSSVSEGLEVARTLVPVPVIKIDEAMADEAVRTGERIAVVATVKTTVEPTVRLIQRKAVEQGRTVRVDVRLVQGAFEALSRGDGALHDQKVLDEVRDAARTADVVVLAQASMSRLLPVLGNDVRVPVLTSPALAVQRVLARCASGRPARRPEARARRSAERPRPPA